VTWCDTITRFDTWLLTWMQLHATPAGIRAAAGISLLGSAVALWILGLGMGIVLATGRRWIILAGWFAACGGGGLLEFTLKNLIRRPRPPGAEAHLYHWSWSLPSGHALDSLVGYGMLAYVLTVLWVDHPSRRLWVLVGAAVLIAAIGFSRLYLGVHYFSDVVAGYVVGALWLSVCIWRVEVARRRPG
jgi:undecaprenyl-diphosphatase